MFDSCFRALVNIFGIKIIRQIFFWVSKKKIFVKLS